MRPARQWTLFAALTLLLSIAVVSGCGMKRPPLPPLKEGNIIAPPTDLSYTKDGLNIVLTWHHTVDAETARVKPEGFKVFAATKTADQCEGCPFIFKEIGTVPMPHMQFHFTMEKGLQYYLRVQALGGEAHVSTFSKTLSIESENQ